MSSKSMAERTMWSSLKGSSEYIVVVMAMSHILLDYEIVELVTMRLVGIVWWLLDCDQSKDSSVLVE